MGTRTPTTTTVGISTTVYVRMKAHQRDTGVSLKWQINKAITEWLDKQEKRT